MTGWKLTLRAAVDGPVDASAIDLSRWRGADLVSVQQTELSAAGRTVTVGDLFDVAVDSGADDRLSVGGNLKNFHHMGARHRAGQLWIDGDIGDHLGGAVGASRVGMTGGRIVVGGSAGHYAGHRMRRGEIWIAGNAGDFAAASMVAGTIVVVGALGNDPATAMQRGTLIASKIAGLSPDRFTEPVETDFPFAALVKPPNLAEFLDFWQSVQGGRVYSRRGDCATGGVDPAGNRARGRGELVVPWPRTSETAYDTTS